MSIPVDPDLGKCNIDKNWDHWKTVYPKLYALSEESINKDVETAYKFGFNAAHSVVSGRNQCVSKQVKPDMYWVCNPKYQTGSLENKACVNGFEMGKMHCCFTKWGEL
jgi:hypothetical protein